MTPVTVDSTVAEAATCSSSKTIPTPVRISAIFSNSMITSLRPPRRSPRRWTATIGANFPPSFSTASFPTAARIGSCRPSAPLAPDAAVVIVTGFSDLEGAVDAMRLGAADYILKPVNADGLRLRVKRLIERRSACPRKERGDIVFRHLVEAAECLIVMFRPDHSIVYFSPHAEALTGYPAAEVVGRDYLTLFVPLEDRETWTEQIRRVFAGDRSTARKDGSSAATARFAGCSVTRTASTTLTAGTSSSWWPTTSPTASRPRNAPCSRNASPRSVTWSPAWQAEPQRLATQPGMPGHARIESHRPARSASISSLASRPRKTICSASKTSGITPRRSSSNAACATSPRSGGKRGRASPPLAANAPRG